MTIVLLILSALVGISLPAFTDRDSKSGTFVRRMLHLAGIGLFAAAIITAVI